MSKFLKTAEGRETSIELMRAILEVANGDDVVADRIWSEPTDAEMLAIWEKVTKNGLTPSTDFVWGFAGSDWAIDVEMSQ